jgi:hypothetical protein
MCTLNRWTAWKKWTVPDNTVGKNTFNATSKKAERFEV